MTKKEWVKAVMDGRPTDRIPVGFWHHFIPHEQMPRMAYHPELMERYFDANRRWKQEFDPDFVKIMTDGFLMLPVDIGDGSADGIASLQLVDPALFEQKTLEIVRGVREIYGDDILLLANLFSPLIALVKAFRAVHPDNTYAALAEMMRKDPEKITAGLNRMTDALAAITRAVTGPGMADGIYLCSRMCTLPPEIFTELVAPTEIRLLEAAGGISGYNILHICDFDGRQSDITAYRPYPAKVINWSVRTEGISLQEGRKLFSGRTVLGGLGMKNTDVLYTGPDDALRREIRRIVGEAGRERMILGADCTVDPGIDVRHLCLAREYANEE